jgi:hypothetical protein
LHFDIAPITVQIQNEVDNPDLLRSGEGDQMGGRIIPDLHTAEEPLMLFALRRIRHEFAVKLLESFPKAKILGCNAEEGIHDAVPIAAARITG